MNVYVLVEYVDTPEETGCQVLGAYAETNLSGAQAEMREGAEKRKDWCADIGMDDWDDDLCEDTEMCLAFGKYGSPGCDVVYRWEIIEAPLL